MTCNVNNRGKILNEIDKNSLELRFSYPPVVPRTISVKSGDKVTFEWYHD